MSNPDSINGLEQQVFDLKQLLHHAWIHDNYRDLGFMQMTTDQKRLLVALLQSWDCGASAERLMEFIAPEIDPEKVPAKEPQPKHSAIASLLWQFSDELDSCASDLAGEKIGGSSAVSHIDHALRKVLEKNYGPRNENTLQS